MVFIEENAKGTLSLDSLACNIFLLLYLFSSSCVVILAILVLKHKEFFYSLEN